MNKELREKLVGELIWSGTKQGGFQRSQIYNQNTKVSSLERKELRDRIKSFCFKNLYLKNRTKPLSEKSLISLINKLSREIKKKFRPILNNGEFQFGNSQKFVNLYLKFMWIIGESSEPPHFPVDRLIQKGFKVVRSWTNMNEEEYLKVIKIAKEIAVKENLSLAVWEAKAYELIKK